MKDFKKGDRANVMGSGLAGTIIALTPEEGQTIVTIRLDDDCSGWAEFLSVKVFLPVDYYSCEIGFLARDHTPLEDNEEHDEHRQSH